MDPISVTWENRPGVPPALTVTQLARLIRDTVRANPILSRILVRGEVSNLQPAPSGHVFFTLKDATAQLSCTLFREDAELLGFDLEDGMDVVVSGDNVHAVLEIKAEQLGILAEEGAGELRGRILQGEENMARWRGLQVAHLAAYEDPGEYRVRPHRVSDQAGELGDREGRGDAWSVFPRNGDRIHSPLSAHASWKVSTDGGEIAESVS